MITGNFRHKETGKSFVHLRTPIKLLLKSMKGHFFIALITYITLISTAFAGTLTISWNRNTEPDIAGYKIYYGTSSGNYPNVITINDTNNNGGQTQYTISGLLEGQTYYLAMKAFDRGNNESAFSQEIIQTIDGTDSDGDSLADNAETSTYGTDPNLADTDGDGINDGDEIAYWGSDWNKDSDGDGIINILDLDSDNDGYLDGLEIGYGYDPGDSSSHLNHPPIEVGTINIDSSWHRVNFKNIYGDPIVVAVSLSKNYSDPATIRIRKIDSTGFEIRIHEWNYLDGDHASETVCYIVMERGSYVLSDGTKLEAGRFYTYKTSNFDNILFKQPFNHVPVVLTSVCSWYGGDTVTTRLKNITRTGFEVTMEEQEANEQIHTLEKVCYIAWEPSQGVIDDLSFEVAKTNNEITDANYNITFAHTFTNTPAFLAQMQTTDEQDPSNIRWENITSNGITIHVSEEQSVDAEVSHSSEIVGYIAILSTDDTSGDVDKDGLTSDQEVDVYNTNPANSDTDNDGINDGDEVEYWGEDWNQDVDNDGIVNLLDPDSDNDGYLDGVEISYGYDPADPNSHLKHPPIEFGTINIDNYWHRVSFKNYFKNPVVVAASISENDAEPATVRIRNVDSSGFEIRVQEWNYLDGMHAPETVSYVVMEKGSHELGDGTRIEAGKFYSYETSSFDSIIFNQEFNQVPVVMTSICSWNGGDAVVPRLRNISRTGFEFRMQEQEINPQIHTLEEISYIAWEPSEGAVDDLSYEIGKTDNEVTNDEHEIQFTHSFSETPAFLAEMQTTDGADTANLRQKGLNSSNVSIHVAEEQSRDEETSHTTEVAGYFVLQNNN